MNLFKIVNTDQVYFDMHMQLLWSVLRLHGACIGFESPLGWVYVQLVLKIVTPCLTGLALTGPYSGIVQELANSYRDMHM